MTYKDHIQRLLKYLFWGMLIALVLLLFISWVLSVYVDGVQGLLTTRGIRWMCVNIVPNFASVHIAKLMLGLMAISVLRESGILRAFRSHISRCCCLTLCSSAHSAPSTTLRSLRDSSVCWLASPSSSAMSMATLLGVSPPCVTSYRHMRPSLQPFPTIS